MCMEVIINFDESQKAWRQNKQSIGYGSFKYICGAKCKNGDKCHNKPFTKLGRCQIHKWNKLPTN